MKISLAFSYQIVWFCFLLSLPIVSSGQITGKVLDELGEPLPFASVYVQNSTVGVTANVEGEYKLILEKGVHSVVYQYIGFKQHIEKITVGNTPIVRNVQLQPNTLEISEVVIHANDEDPAYPIMRQAIAKRSFYKNRVEQYSCDVYVKGFNKLLDAPKKILGQEVGNMGGVLDTNRTGVIYLSESVSKLYRTFNPDQVREVMISSKVSGESNGFSLNRATLTDFSLYSEHLDVDRPILSPLADNAFAYYKFRLEGTFRDENGYTINQIAVIPKRSHDPVFAGIIYIVDGYWNLQGANLFLTGDNIHQPILDTLSFSQQFIPVEAPDKWCLLNQVTSYKFGVFGFKIRGFFNSVFSNYSLQLPKTEDKLFSNEVFKVEKGANEKDSSYWDSVRPVPLTTEESHDYVRKDSLQKIWKSEHFLDSMDRKHNHFAFGDLLFGYTYAKTFKKTYYSFKSPLTAIQFNTVQGWNSELGFSYRKFSEEDNTKSLRIEPYVSYGLSEKVWRGELSVKRLFNSINFANLELSGGTKVEQFNANRPISTTMNSLNSLIGAKNYMKLYDKAFGKVGFSRELTNGLYLWASGEYADRKPLVNHTNYSFSKKDSSYTSNDPLMPDNIEPSFERHQALILDAVFRIRFGQKYLSYPNRKYFDSYNHPDIFVGYRKGIPKLAGADADFDLLTLRFSQSDLSWGVGGSTEWMLEGGTFLNNKRVEFVDYKHFMGNQTFIGNPENYRSSFFQLPYYAFSTNQSFVHAHVQHHLNGWLLDKIPGLRKLNISEVVSFNALYTDQNAEDGAASAKMPYWEASFGLDNLGFGVFRLFRVDVVSSFMAGKYEKTGVVIGLKL